MKPNERSAIFLEGLDACRRGVSKDKNPHWNDFERWFEWALGWDSIAITEPAPPRRTDTGATTGA